jgi:putative membrane protein
VKRSPVDTLFSAADREAIRAAVAEAERRTAGEIVPYVVPESDAYPNASWRGAALGALAAPLLAWAVHRLAGLWGGQHFVWMVLPAAAGAALGYLLAATPAVKRLLAGAATIDLRVRRRAAVAFLEQELFRTRGRTGILIFLSLFEHRVVVLGDSGINRLVEPGEWDGIVRTIVAGIRAGRPGDAVAAAVRECGALLERCGVARSADDVDELENRLRQEESS